MPSTHVSTRQRIVIGGGLVLSLVSWLVVKPWNTIGWMIGAPFGRDYVNFWLAPRLVMSGEGWQLVNLTAYNDSARAAFGLGHDPGLVFVYPPHALLFLAPLALLPFLPAVCLWTAVNLAALGATLRFCGDRSPIPRATLAWVVCLSPAAVAMIIYGHFGGLLALASTLVIVEGERRPWLAGFCLACLTVKPQFAGMLGFVLLCGGRWRCLLPAALCTLALVGLSFAAFGFEPWRRFVTLTVPFQSAVVSEFHANWIMTSVTPYFTARFFEVPAALAWAIQGVVAALGLGAAILALRSRTERPVVLTVVLLAVIVSQPYASHYDLAAVAPALSLLVLDDEAASERPPFALLAWLLVPLARILAMAGAPVISVILVATLWVESRRLLAGWRSPLRAAASVPAAG
ncbi:glycosyltransferase family 87 protein [Methylobacterium haplocladii]|uniref:DUF2029 domain-containing protein n=1 Tax=Methylobacterium haplocladii TaxID=1176176 RepID=A0A512IKK3_9HYPH|nr:glycosyltransferase family 87 protein [Methylobacterium haplocladii]GEO98229.1 hypothetical protein MHA02_06170 [Methylobacterium haplocladii]GJD84376.1 hypothetical protein HPGCJGGD_2252 [Methylobacterium haplocladii]GLS59987.1 hypothetical protein GCM10007887_26630 [Methylobacterium haplocladii]